MEVAGVRTVYLDEVSRVVQFVPHYPAYLLHRRVP